MARWLVPLTGDIFDLEQYPRCFPNGEIYAIEEDGKFFLVGPGFERLGDADAVFDLANSILGLFTTSIDLISPGIIKPDINCPIRETDEGLPDLNVRASENLRVRDNVNDVVVNGAAPTAPARTQTQEILDQVIGNSHLKEAYIVWSEPGRNWTRLYRVLEEIEQHLGMRVNQAYMCSRAERGRFRRTANSAMNAGIDARHASGQFAPPTNPMTVEEATQFIRGLLFSVSR